jgi:hypothetical protein
MHDSRNSFGWPFKKSVQTSNLRWKLEVNGSAISKGG